MKKLISSLYFHILGLALIAGVLAGCGSWFAKRQGEEKGNSVQQKNDYVSITVQNQPPYLCPKLLEGSHNTVTNNFLYVLDTSDQKCIATNWQDLFGENKLFPFRMEDSLAFERKDNLVWNKQWDENHTYKQYYKGIPVENSRVMLNFRNGKIMRLVGTFFPNLNIDTTGMISKEEAARVAVENGNFYPEFMSRIDVKRTAEIANFGVVPHVGGIFYSFEFNKLSQKPGTYIVNALTGRFHKFVPADDYHLTDCYKCLAANSQTLTCQDTCTVNTCTTFTDHRQLHVPTIYNGCQPIYADSCNVSGKIVYRMAPLSIGINDSINVYDASNYYTNYPAPPPLEVKYCYTDSILTKQKAIAVSLYYAASVSRSYYQSKNIDYKQPLKILAHFPGTPFDPINNSAGWYQSDLAFQMGDGDGITTNPLASVDVVAHEYGHAVLRNTFIIRSDSVHVNQPQVRAIHEAVSDIFSVLVRKHAFGTIDWTIGNQVVITPSGNLPRDLAHPENTIPPQALYYNDPTAYWDTAANKIYNHAGIIVKWFYLITNGGTGIKFPTDGITVQAIGLDAAENVLIAGLQKLLTDSIAVPTYQNFCEATTLAAHALYPPSASGECSPQLTAVRKAWQAVGLDCWTAISPPLCTTCLPTDPQSDACDQLPYIQSVQIIDIATGNLITYQNWEWNTDQSQLCLVKYVAPELTTDLTQGLQVSIVTSEPMSNLSFITTLSPTGASSAPAGIQSFGSENSWFFTLSDFVLNDFSSNNFYRLQFIGQDLAGNSLISLHQYPGADATPPCIDANALPYKNAEGNWENYITGYDNSSGFTYGCSLSAEVVMIVCDDLPPSYSVLFAINTSCAEEVTWVIQMDWDDDGVIDQISTSTTPIEMGTTVEYSPFSPKARFIFTNTTTLEQLVVYTACQETTTPPECENDVPLFTNTSFTQNLQTCIGDPVCISYHVTDQNGIQNVTCSVAGAVHSSIQTGFTATSSSTGYYWQQGTFCFTPTPSNAEEMTVFLHATDNASFYCAETGAAIGTVSVLCCPTAFNYPQELTAVYDCQGNLYQPATATVTALTTGCTLPFTVNGSANHTLTNLEAGSHSLTIAFNNETIDIPNAITVTGIYLDETNLQVTHTAQPSAPACGNDLCCGSTTLQVQGGSGSYTYYWADCEAGGLLCNSPYRNYLCSGAYTVTIVDDITGCQTVYTANVGITYPTNAGTITDNEFSVNPTVFSGSTTLAYRVAYDAQVSIKLFNNMGNLVSQPITNEFRAEGQYNHPHTPPQGLPPGLYYYVLYVCEQPITRVAVKVQ